MRIICGFIVLLPAVSILFSTQAGKKLDLTHTHKLCVGVNSSSCAVCAMSVSRMCVGLNETPMNSTTIRYVALGDSYTICEGASEEESWPVILTKHLNENKIKTELIANPSRTGWTTQDLIDNELKIFDASNANFATLCIGVNDWVRGVDKEKFHKNLNFIIDHLQNKLSDKTKILLITIPDFSMTPQGKKYGNGRNISEGIAEFNSIILAEAKKRNLKTVDLFPLSKGMLNDPSLIAKDGLHPSAKEYALWEALIFPVMKEMLMR